MFFTWKVSFSTVIRTLIVPCWSHVSGDISFPREVKLQGVENSPVTQYSWLLYAKGLIGRIIKASNWVSHLNSGNDTWCIICLHKCFISMFLIFSLFVARMGGQGLLIHIPHGISSLWGLVHNRCSINRCRKWDVIQQLESLMRVIQQLEICEC